MVSSYRLTTSGQRSLQNATGLLQDAERRVMNPLPLSTMTALKDCVTLLLSNLCPHSLEVDHPAEPSA
jgi:hypothetical protein